MKGSDMPRTDDAQPDVTEQPQGEGDPGWLSPADQAAPPAPPAEAFPANAAPLPPEAVDNPDAEPEHPSYCHRGDCDVDQVMLWRPVTERPAMCQCGQLLNAERLDQPQPEPEPAQV